MNVIDIVDLGKTYTYYQKEPGLRAALVGLLHRQTHERRAVEGLSFSVVAGEFVGFLGPNGAGKTTTLKMLSGLLYPSAGNVEVLGHTPARREPAFLRQIALVMGQKSLLNWDLSTMETLLLHKELYRLPERAFRATVVELAELLMVGNLLRVPVRKLSLGERMKLELLAALVHRPAVLFLDEPTIGLDVVAAQRVRDFLRDLNRVHGTTILLTSHAMNDIEALCPRVLVIDGGRLRFDGPLARLVSQADPHKLLTVVFAEPVEAAALTDVASPEQLRASDDPHKLCLAVPREEVGATTARVLRLGRVVDLSVAEPPIEDVMRALFLAGAERSAA